MASRFVVADNDVIEELKTSSKTSNTIEKVQIYGLELRNGQH
jgi:hypothetical protein